MFLTDSYFTIGSSHEVCQDYALDSSDMPMVVLSDGCSSNTHSDFGSRILVRNALNKIGNNGGIASPKEVIFKSRYIADQLNLESSDLNATLLAVTALDEFKVQVFGDGVVVARERESKELYVIQIEYPSGAPFYLQYLLDDESSLRRWKDLYSAKVVINTFKVKTDGTFLPIMTMELDEGFKDNQIHMYQETFDYATYDMVAVLSDGIHSFQHTDNGASPFFSKSVSPVTFDKVLPLLFDFKQMNGVFLRRRCNKFFKDCAKKNWSHYDDFSIAAIYVGDNQ